MPHTAYVKDASGRGMQCVTRPDRFVFSGAFKCLRSLKIDLDYKCFFIRKL